MDTCAIQSELSAALGCNVHVGTEYGLSVFNQDTCTPLLSESKVPAKLSAQWILARIAKKAQASDVMRERREKGIAAMKAGLAEKGIGNQVSCYATSFGFSVCNLFRDGMKAAQEIIEKCGIEHKRVEYSEAHWVVRVIL